MPRIDRFMHRLWLAGALALLSGCAAQTVLIRPAASVPALPERQRVSADSQTFWLGGLGQHQMLDAVRLCGGADHVMGVRTRQTPLEGSLSVLTLGIYSPRTAEVFCQ